LREDVVRDLDLLLIFYHRLYRDLGNRLLSEIVVPEANITLIVYIGQALVLYGSMMMISAYRLAV
jgi:hypothetical protein